MGKKNSKMKKDIASKLAQETHFSKREVRQWYKGFLKDCPNGRLTEKGFLRIYEQFFPHGDPSQFAKFVFRVFDENQDGSIEFEEFIKALSTTSRGTMEERLQWAFKLYDIDSDGFITRSEMIDILDAMHTMMGSSINIKSETDPKIKVEQIFQHLDTNKDGRLSLDEFLEGSKTNPKIVQTLTFCK